MKRISNIVDTPIYQLPGSDRYQHTEDEAVSSIPTKKTKFDRELSKENDENANRHEGSSTVLNFVLNVDDGQDVAPKRSKTTRRRGFPIKVTRIRARRDTMSIEELQDCLDRKLEEKINRSGCVKLIDRTHVQCLGCPAVISLNRKFEVCHIIRHFSSWHKTNHFCTRTWPGLEGRLYTKSNTYLKLLHGCPKDKNFFTGKEISFVPKDEDVVKKVTSRDKCKKPLYGPEKSSFNVRCNLCGFLMEHRDVSTHFLTCHSENINAPRCNLCTQEVLINAELKFLYEKDYQISIVDEESTRSITLNRSFGGVDDLYKVFSASDFGESTYSKDNSLDEAINMEDPQEEDTLKVEGSNNSRDLGKGAKPKRVFVHPRYRQAVPENSRFVEELAINQWRCKLCDAIIVGAVISSAATKHFKKYHYEDSTYFDEGTNKERYNPKSIFYQFSMELCDARLIKCSRGSMRMIDERTICCKECNGDCMNLHKDFNICRGIKHLKSKHPELMPEHNESVDGEIINSGDLCGIEDSRGLLLDEDLPHVYEVKEESFSDHNDTISHSGAQDNLVPDVFKDYVPASSLGGESALLAPTIKEECLFNPQENDHDLTGLPYKPNNSLSRIETAHRNIFEDASYDDVISCNVDYDDYVSNNFPDYSSTSPSYLYGLNSMEHSDNYPSSSLLPSQGTLGIQLYDGSTDFFAKVVDYQNYPIPMDAVDSIIMMHDIDGRECYILMTEADELNFETAFKIFRKDY
uniref:C2H2-type domain-containing protein n=1 Tax=Strongyloides papillosus TaxID=174720 RepID=A0A0N5BHJ1_STREA